MTTAIQVLSRLIFDLCNYHKIIFDLCNYHKIIFDLCNYHKISDSRGTKHVCLCVCVLDGEGSRVVAGTALVIVWTAVYLTSYSVYLTGFQEPLSPLYTCHTGLKNVWE